MRRILKVIVAICVVFVVSVFFVKWGIDYEKAETRSIEMETQMTLPAIFVDENYRLKQTSIDEPQHPFLASLDQSMMHAGGWQSDIHPAAGVFTKDVTMTTRRAGGWITRQCATFTFTSKGQPLMLCGGFTGFRLNLLDPDTLDRLADYKLPMRPSSMEALVKRDMEYVFTDTSGGAYFYLDHQDRAVIADAEQHIKRIKPVETNGKWAFEVQDDWDLGEFVPHDCFGFFNRNPKGECDGITTVLPDYNGLIWWVTRHGRIGSLDPDNGNVEMIQLDYEEIQNSFAVDEKGAYIVSDHAMYHFRLKEGVPTQIWRLPYDRGTGRKVGSINQGSGTSPTLMSGGEGNKAQYVTFTDNADDRIALIVAHKGEVPEGQNRLICEVPIFASGGSATDNSMIARGRSVIVENNHGYTNAITHEDYGTVTGGVARVDVREDESGCDMIWESGLKVPSVVPKLSAGNGIAYFYSFEIIDDDDQLWSLVGLDFETGKEVLRVPTGTGVGFNNNWSSIAIAPNGDTYIGTREGLVKLSDN